MIELRSVYALALVFAAATLAGGCAAEDDGARPAATPNAGSEPSRGDAGSADSAPADDATGPGIGSYESNLTDFTLTVRDVGARLSPVAAASSGGFKSKLKLYLVDYAGYCASYAASVDHAGSKYVKLELDLKGATPAAATLKPGTYAFDQFTDGSGVLYLGRLTKDATCTSTPTPVPLAIAGAQVNRLVITAVTSTHVTGSFEFKAANGSYVRGSFDTDLCDATPAGASTCQ